jgi:glycerol-3-phosphate dehydrogenase subunit B
LNYDVIVIGIGLAGLTASLRLAQAGQKVLVLAKGVGGTHLDGGAIDLLGYDNELVTNPIQAIDKFISSKPRHPYSNTRGTLQLALDWFKSEFERSGYPFIGDQESNLLLPSAIGVPRPTYLAPQTMVKGDLRKGGNTVVVGFSNLKDFFPSMCAENLSSQCKNLGIRLDVRALSIKPPHFQGADTSPMDFTRAFERESFRSQFAEILRPQIKANEVVGLPALLGLDANQVWSDLESRLGAGVFEIPLLPPSIPGMRIFDRMVGMLRSAGGRIQMGFPVVDAIVEGERIVSVSTASATQPQIWRARNYVLATGGISSGGIQVDSHGAASEPIFGLPLLGQPPREARYSRNYFDSHPMSKIGLQVDTDARPVGADGTPVYENLRAVGGMIGGAEPWKEKSGEGIAIVTGFAAAESILREVQLQKS